MYKHNSDSAFQHRPCTGEWADGWEGHVCGTCVCLVSPGLTKLKVNVGYKGEISQAIQLLWTGEGEDEMRECSSESQRWRNRHRVFNASGRGESEEKVGRKWGVVSTCKWGNSFHHIPHHRLPLASILLFSTPSLANEFHCIGPHFSVASVFHKHNVLNFKFIFIR